MSVYTTEIIYSNLKSEYTKYFEKLESLLNSEDVKLTIFKKIYNPSEDKTYECRYYVDTGILFDYDPQSKLFKYLFVECLNGFNAFKKKYSIKSVFIPSDTNEIGIIFEINNGYYIKKMNEFMETYDLEKI